MKRILLFITATLLLASGTSCSDDNTNFDPIGDELGIPYKDGHDVYGVEVWEETSVILTNYYSLIEEIIQEKTAKIQSIWWLSPAKEKCNVRWNCSAPIMGKTDHSSSYIINPDYNMNSSQITIDLTDVTDNFTCLLYTSDAAEAYCLPLGSEVSASKYHLFQKTIPV